MNQFLEIVKVVNDKVSGFVWGVPAMILIVGAGVLLSCGTGFVQFRRFVRPLAVCLRRQRPVTVL